MSWFIKFEMVGIIYLKLYFDVFFMGVIVWIVDVRFSCWVGGVFWFLRLIFILLFKVLFYVVMVELGFCYGLNLCGVMLKYMRRVWFVVILCSCLEFDVECFSGLIFDWFNDNYIEDYDCFFVYVYYNVW